MNDQIPASLPMTGGQRRRIGSSCARDVPEPEKAP